MNCTVASQGKSSGLSIYIKGLRAPFLTASILPMILGISLAYHHEGVADITLTFLILLSGALIHLASNALNDYFDFKYGSDSPDVQRTPFSGGSGLITEGLLPPNRVLALSIGLFSTAFSIGLIVLFLTPGNIIAILMLGLAGIFLGATYTAPPLKLSYRGIGEVAIFFAFGPLPLFSSYYIICGSLSPAPILASLPLGLMTVAILWINQFPDYATDKDAGKKNLLVRIGLDKGRFIYLALLIMASMTLIIGVYFSAISYLSLSGLAYLLFAIPAATILYKNFEKPEKLVPAMGLTIAAHSILALLMIAGSIF